MKVYLLRGIPGSGKSTYQRKMFPDAVVVSADHFFTKPDGSYSFNARALGIAHKVCYDKYVKALEEKQPLIVVDNTNIPTRDIKKYAEAAQKYQFEFEIITLLCDPEIAFQRNVHKVPRETILEMHNKLGRVELSTQWKNTICKEGDINAFRSGSSTN